MTTPILNIHDNLNEILKIMDVNYAIKDLNHNTFGLKIPIRSFMEIFVIPNIDIIFSLYPFCILFG